MCVKDCTECGNPIDDSKMVCPFCNRHQTGAFASKVKKHMYVTINLEQGRPFVEEAVRKLERAINAARGSAKVVRIIHGWGSTGTGGKIKTDVHHRMESLRCTGKVKQFVPGENYSETTNAGRDLLRRFSDLKKTLQSDRANPGISFIEL